MRNPSDVTLPFQKHGDEEVGLIQHELNYADSA